MAGNRSALVRLFAMGFALAAGLLSFAAPSMGADGGRNPTGPRPCWVFFRVTDPGIAPPERGIVRSEPGIARPEPGIVRSEPGIAPSAPGIVRPAPASLSTRAVRRLEKVGLVPGADRSDHPLPASLLDPIRERGLSSRVRHLSRWLQAASVLLTPEEARALASDPRVRSIRPVSRFGRGLPAVPLPGEAGERSLPAVAKEAGTAADRDPRTLTPVDYGPTWDQLEMLGIPELHHMGLSGAGVMVALFDTGFYKDHASLIHLLKVAERDFVRGDNDTEYNPHDPGDTREADYHGTYTWSALGGFDPGRQMGGAYHASFVLAKTEDVLREVHAEEDNYIAALEWADSLGVDVVSTSLGYRYFDDGSGYTFGELDGETLPITIATERAAERGILVITAMGNEGPEPATISAPADGKRVVSVGAVDFRRAVATFSSRGPTADGRIKPDVDAQGIGVACASASSPLAYAYASGTSLSTPLVAGLATLLLEARPDWGPDSLIAALRRSGDRASAPDNDVGWGTADGLRALRSGGARLAVPRYVWIDENAIIDGAVGFGETGALRLWIRNVGAQASGEGTVRVGLHDPIFSLIDSTATVPPLPPNDSALVTVARMSIGDGDRAGYYPFFVRIGAAGDTVDRRVLFPVIPAYSISGLQASPGPFGTIHVAWRTAGAAITRSRLYRSAPPDTSREVVFEESTHRDQVEWIDRPPHTGAYQYWVSVRLIGGSESSLLGPVQAVTSLPSRMLVGSPFPNPASGGNVTIPVAWTSEEIPRVEIYDVAGRRVRSFAVGERGAGFPLITWDLTGEDGRPVATGWYVVRVRDAGSSRMLVVR